jgi:hypothetical protein
MKLFTTALTVGCAHAMIDCGKLNDSQGTECQHGFDAPHCDTGELCVQSREDVCSYSCQTKCADGQQKWTKTIPSDTGDEYVDYCATTPLGDSYSCGLVDGISRVTATFIPIIRAYGKIDNREYEFYNARFSHEDYEFGMFGKASDSCKRLLNKNIDNSGVTTFEFDLDGENSIREACGVQPKDFTKQEDGQKNLYQTFEWALGYENFSRITPGGVRAVSQPGRHTNFECTMKLSGDTAVDFGVTHKRKDAYVVDDIEIEFKMRICKDRDCNEPYAKHDRVELELGPEMTEPRWLYFEVSQENAKTKYTHMAKCELVLLDKDGNELPTGYQVIENGCVSSNIDEFQPGFGPGTFDEKAHFVYVSEDERKNDKTAHERADRFGLQIFDVDKVANYQVRCHLHACEYGNERTECALRDSCPIAGRYDAIVKKSNVRKRRSSTDLPDPKIVESEKFEHPCLKFKLPENTEARYLCFPKGSDNCWLRTACEGRF